MRPTERILTHGRSDDEQPAASFLAVDLWNDLLTLLIQDCAALGQAMARSGVDVLETRRALELLGLFPLGPRAAEVWCWLVGASGIDMGELEDDWRLTRLQNYGGKLGCSWHRCVMYNRPVCRVSHRCDGCEAAVYCGTMCQMR